MLTATFSLFNVIMGLLGFYYTPPEVFMFVVWAILAVNTYFYAQEDDFYQISNDSVKVVNETTNV